MKRLLRVGVMLALLPATTWAGSPVRYALIIGNNRADPRAIEIEPLLHAEREAKEIAAKLVRYANFDSARVETVVGGGRRDVLGAAKRLAERHRLDRAELGDLPALFAFFFTGHGLSGKLVTADGSLAGQDIAAIVSQMDTSLTLGFFDACYAGSLAMDPLRGKGVTVTPGFNPVRELPSEILDSEGTMWFVSSRENEVSYEDERIGGLFMHFFSESFTQAGLDGVGIPLETMWEYARRRTAEAASRNGRVQTPEKIVRSLKARGPLYFSFPKERTATLRFDAPVEGTFLIQYVQADLAEKVEKHAGAALDVAAFEGEVVLKKVPGVAASQRFTLRRGEQVVVRPSGAGAAELRRSVGFSETTVRAKGELPGLLLTRDQVSPHVALGVGYRYASLPDSAFGAVQHVVVDGRFIRGPLSVGLELSYGKRRREYEAWSYSLWDGGLQASAAYGIETKIVRLDLEIGGGPSITSLRYGSGESRKVYTGWLGGGPRLLVPIPTRSPRVLVWVKGAMGVSFSKGTAANDNATHSAAAPQFEAGISVPIGVGRRDTTD